MWLWFRLLVWCLLPWTGGVAAGDSERQAEAVIMEADVNGVRKGDVVVFLPGEGNPALWIKATDFARLGIGLKDLEKRQFGETAFLRLSDRPNLGIRIDMDQLKLTLEAAPALLGMEVTSLSGSANLRVSPPPGTHGFINYSLATQQSDNTPARLAGEIAGNLAVGEWVLHSEHSLSSGNDLPRQRRLKSFVQREWPDNMIRMSLGDVAAPSGVFGRAGPMGGINISRVFELQPGFVRAPTLSYAGSVTVPSNAEIYVDGAKLRTVPLKPGLFEFRDIYYFAGLRNVEIAVVDATGRRQVTAIPYYFTDLNLATGLHEFSYSLGRMRRDQTTGAAYEDPGIAGFHRYGLNNALTAGVSGESFSGYTSFSGTLTSRLASAGAVTATLANSSSKAGNIQGSATLVGYAYAGGPMSFAASMLRQSRNFAHSRGSSVVLLSPNALRDKVSTNFNFAFDSRQSAGIDFSQTSTYESGSTSVLSLRHSLRISQGVSLLTSVARRNEPGGAGLEINLGFSINFDGNWSINARIETRDGQNTESVRASRAAPAADGVGGNVALTRTRAMEAIEGFAQYNAPAGILTGSMRQVNSPGMPPAGGSELRVSGGLAFMDESFYASRPIDQSFAVLDVAGLQGVRAYQNNQYIGRTRADGKLIAPSLGAYTANQMRIDDRDIPMDISLDRVADTAVPRTLMGSLVRFAFKRISSAGGHLVMRTSGNRIPVESARLEARNGDFMAASTTGPDGDFYLDDLAPGEYRLLAESATTRCRARFVLGEKQGPFTDFGDIDCEPAIAD